MRNFKLTVSYDGQAYAGWQVQPGQPTIQGTLQALLCKITTEQVTVIGSGRTDSGVHAIAQVASFRSDTYLSPEVLCKALNASLPRDIVVQEMVEVLPDFHPIRDALRKRYRYLLHDGNLPDVFRRHYCWYRPQPLDVNAMIDAAVVLLGTHDFSSFETTGAPRKTSIRTVFDISLMREVNSPDFIQFEIEADGFLYNMVRSIIGSLEEIGRGKKTKQWLAEVLQACDRTLAGKTAPAHGLFLLSVKYPPVELKTPNS